MAEQVGAWEWLTRDILPYFPVLLGRSGRGVWFREWRCAARHADAVATLTVGRNAERLSAVAALSLDDAYTGITGTFGLDVRSGLPLFSATITGDPRASGVARHRALNELWALTGRRETSISVPVVADPATRWGVLEYLATRYASPLREVWYRVAWQDASLRPGDVVAVVDAEPDIDGIGTITARRPAPGAWDLRVLLHP